MIRITARINVILGVVLLGLLLVSPEVIAGQSSQEKPSSTFVGNGGDIQDIDLAATLGTIHEMALNLSPTSNTLCSCSDKWVETELCTILRQLSSQERDACRKMLVKYASQLADLSARNAKIEFRWSDRTMKVRKANGSERIVQAVTQPDKRVVTIQRDKFYEMPASYRAALLTHELFHMIKHEDQYISDEIPLPPFESGQAMLDTLGAAIAMEANEEDIFTEYNALRRVSRPHKPHWLSIEFGSVSHSQESAKQLLKSNSSIVLSGMYTYRWGDLGLDLSYENVANSSHIGTKININEAMYLWGVGVNYRWYPINFYLSRWNQSFINLGLGAYAGRAIYAVDDGWIGLKDRALVSALQSTAKVFIPTQNNLWITFGFQLRKVRYEYNVLKIKTFETQSVASIGGAYGL